jgi:hypothetical protein
LSHGTAQGISFCWHGGEILLYLNTQGNPRLSRRWVTLFFHRRFGGIKVADIPAGIAIA